MMQKMCSTCTNTSASKIRSVPPLIVSRHLKRPQELPLHLFFSRQS
ncbi:putative disease resistance protein RGA4 [Iris pallida]|uniref:Disease resistance protein RGA4 n=1 Tax=Iris pallida TaxID=29817 RepID=A0AAX6ILG5_IRIPA|nr:putative disease resistance protein RGA4 [Iris pallida]